MEKRSTKIIGHDWSLAQIWEDGFRGVPERPMKARNYIYASELGGSFHDRYLKMNAHPFSNPYNFRSQAKMMAGKFFESVVRLVLIGTGIYKSAQLSGRIEIPKCLPVSGKLDFIAGGNIDWDEAVVRAKSVKDFFSDSFGDLDSFTHHMVDKILIHFKNLYTHAPMMEKVLEIKSVSGFVFQLIDKGGKPRRGHPLQTVHYLLANKHIEKGLLTYISREDVMIREFEITRGKGLLNEYKEDVATMSAYYNDGVMNYKKHIPPKDTEVLFEEASFRFVKSNHVEYSPYLTESYGYKNIDHFKEMWDKRLAKWNAAFKRNVLEGTPTGKLGKPLKLTDDNKINIEDGRKHFEDWDKYVLAARKAGAFLKPESEEDEE